MKKVIVFILFIFLILLLFFSSVIVTFVGIEYFMMENPIENWSILINNMPDENKILLAIAILLTGIVSLLGIVLIIQKYIYYLRQ